MQGSDSHELVLPFLALMDVMVHDIQYLKAETIRVRYKPGGYLDQEHKCVSSYNILLGLDIQHYDSLVYSRNLWGFDIKV